MQRTNFSNRYIFIYITILVVAIAAVLALAATLLQQKQEDNRKIEKMQSILRSVGIETSTEDAMSFYQKYITEESDGDRPVYIAQIASGNTYIFPLQGKGLWGPVWGFIALKEDMNTVVGITLDHKGETPGLGAQIATEGFQSQFKGKKIFDDKGNFMSITLVKGGVEKFSGNRVHAVDAISGGTLTSNGVTEMLFSSLRVYEPFMKERLNIVVPAADIAVEQDTVKEIAPVYYRRRDTLLQIPDVPANNDTSVKTASPSDIPQQSVVPQRQQPTVPQESISNPQQYPASEQQPAAPQQQQPSSVPQQSASQSQQSDVEQPDPASASEKLKIDDTQQVEQGKSLRKKRDRKKSKQADE
ncbi:MAG: NADH:ubiquinone reductase (Na(+)-transporting) subunit C [Bacteroidales bacterium]|jgi:Na+-transporting NADH:ubiquinone oxidoreductase subunit C|nr:NADH:ubiquinone reductase (Na(+)-transporting) subunit C [Bacteroidales bacterium]